MPIAYIGTAYSNQLTVIGGTAPYAWQITAGVLPGGLSFNTNSGVISGTPAVTGISVFTAQVWDAASVTTNQVFNLPVLQRLELVSSTNMSSAILNVPYDVSLQSQGGTAPYQYNTDTVLSNEVVIGYNPANWVGGGTAQGWSGDETNWSFALPWGFPFYDTIRTSVCVSANGFIDFARRASDPNSSVSTLASNARVAAVWADLVTRDVYLTTNASRVVIRWDASTIEDQVSHLNMEVVLYRNGDISINFGDDPDCIYLTGPVIGIGRGNGTNYLLSSYNGTTSVPVYQSLYFQCIGGLPADLTLDSNGHLYGTPTVLGDYMFQVRVADSASAPFNQVIYRNMYLSVR